MNLAVSGPTGDMKAVLTGFGLREPFTAAVPDLAGIVLKADSEGRVGPSVYHRTHADAANLIARPLAPHGGLLLS